MDTSNNRSTNDVVKTIVNNPGKSLEKFALYVMGSLTTANVINVHNFKPWLVTSIAGILAAIHLSTGSPKKA